LSLLTPSSKTPKTVRPEARPAASPTRSRWRRILAGTVTVMAAVLVFFALATPNNISRLPEGSSTSQALIRIPIEALIGVAILLAMPGRARKAVAVIGGVLLGLLTLIKIIDMGFYAALSRPFNPVLDWVLLDDAITVLEDSIGRTGTRLVLVGAVLLLVLVPVLMSWSVVRLTRFAERHRTAAARSVLALSAAWVVLALLGTHFVSTVFISSDSAITLARESALKLPEDLRDRKKFAAEVAVDSFRDTPGTELLGALQGKDVLFTFIESYGRSAVEDPDYAPQIGAMLTAGTARLAAAGFSAQSAWLTAPTAGGGSWLAHSTFQSGVWINNEQRYRSLVSGDRLTLTRAFKRANWQTVGVEPGLTYAWPEGTFYGFDRVYDSRNLGYKGPKFSWASMPDQFTLQAFETLERSKRTRAPLMAEITFVSSHTPWAPIPELIDWDAIGDGSIYGPMTADDAKPSEVWKDDKRIRAEYRRSIEYSVGSLISYLERYGDDDLVMVFLGDHQPAPVVTGANASRDVPVTIVAKDKAVLAKMAGWGWQDGLQPGPLSPVTRMDTFRDQFLTAFSR
jgi:hypothetical protein